MPALAVLLAKESQQLQVVWKVSHVERDGLGDEGLEGGFAMKQATGQREQACGAGPKHQQERIEQRVGFDEGSVQVDAERTGGG